MKGYLNKRGVELSIQVIIVAVLALVVLIVLIVIFTGKTTFLANQTTGLTACESRGGSCEPNAIEGKQCFKDFGGCSGNKPYCCIPIK